MTKDKFYENYVCNNNCWEWTRYINKHGYDHVYFNRKMWSVHRYSYFVTFGEIPEGLCVLHKCDNRKCINPEHLYLGNNMQNVNDRVNRKRGAIAERNASTKLTVKQVIEIKKMIAPLKIIAQKFKVSVPTVSDIKKGRTWKHIEPAENTRS